MFLPVDKEMQQFATTGHGVLTHRFTFLIAAIVWLALLLVPFGSAQAESTLWNLLRKSYDSSKNLSYEGTLATRQGILTHSSRIQHFSTPEGEFEAIERLEGQPSKWIRHNEEIQCVLPERKLILSENRKTSLAFPQYVGNTETLSNLRSYYEISELPVERVAGRMARVLNLEPKDSLRYGYKLFVDKSEGLLLKTESFAGENRLLERVGFTEINFDVDHVAPPKLMKKGEGWREAVSEVHAVDESHLSYTLPAEFHGFTQMQSLCRVKDKDGQTQEVHQTIFSDGLSSISVFVQPAVPETLMPSVPLSQGAVTSLSQLQGDSMVTVLGEVPEETLRQFLTLIKWKSQ